MSAAVGKQVRLNRIMDTGSGRTVIVALDHAKQLGMPQGMENFEQLLADMVEAQPDGILMNPGMFARYHHLFQGRGAPAVILSCDFYATSTIPGPQIEDEGHILTTSVEQIARMGADCVKVLLVFARENMNVYAQNLEIVARVVEDAERFGLPVMIEPTLWGRRMPLDQRNDPELVADVCRIAVELGADIVKAPYGGNHPNFQAAVRYSPVPVTILGGERSENVLQQVEEAVKLGVHGLVFGRNVWQHPTPKAMVAAFKDIVHAGKSAEEAAKRLSSASSVA